MLTILVLLDSVNLAVLTEPSKVNQRPGACCLTLDGFLSSDGIKSFNIGNALPGASDGAKLLNNKTLLVNARSIILLGESSIAVFIYDGSLLFTSNILVFCVEKSMRLK